MCVIGEGCHDPVEGLIFPLVWTTPSRGVICVCFVESSCGVFCVRVVRFICIPFRPLHSQLHLVEYVALLNSGVHLCLFDVFLTSPSQLPERLSTLVFVSNENIWHGLFVSYYSKWNFAIDVYMVKTPVSILLWTDFFCQ